MITVATANSKFELKSTVFPDGTSQVWKLPEEVLQSSSVSVDWRFESEREILDLLSLRTLLPNQNISLHVPYLPYARQDKEVSNSSTFNLLMFANIINSMNFTTVSAVDVHNYARTRELVKRFINVSADDFHAEVIDRSEPDYIVFPDKGAFERYHSSANAHIPKITCDKTRDQLTGNITGHKIIAKDYIDKGNTGVRFLIVDDLCDGGATFVSVAKLLRETYTDANIDLCVTHGLFSRGREALLTNGIDRLYTTDSLTKNGDGYKV